MVTVGKKIVPNVRGGYGLRHSFCNKGNSPSNKLLMQSKGGVLAEVLIRWLAGAYRPVYQVPSYQATPIGSALESTSLHP